MINTERSQALEITMTKSKSREPMDDLGFDSQLLRTRFVCSAKLSQREWGRRRKGPRLGGRSLDPAGDPGYTRRFWTSVPSPALELSRWSLSISSTLR